MAPNLDKVEVLHCRWLILQVGYTWNQVKTCLKCSWYLYVWDDLHFWKDVDEIADKQRSEVENLAKYVDLQDVGTFQIIISVRKD
jgi:hypothetical protein